MCMSYNNHKYRRLVLDLDQCVERETLFGSDRESLLSRLTASCERSEVVSGIKGHRPKMHSG